MEMNELPATNIKNEQERNRKQDSGHGDKDAGPGGDGADGDRGVAGENSGGGGEITMSVSNGNLQFISEYVKRECSLLLEIDKSESTGQEVRDGIDRWMDGIERWDGWDREMGWMG